MAKKLLSVFHVGTKTTHLPSLSPETQHAKKRRSNTVTDIDGMVAPLSPLPLSPNDGCGRIITATEMKTDGSNTDATYTPAVSAMTVEYLIPTMPRVIFVSLYHFVSVWELLPSEILVGCLCVFDHTKQSILSRDHFSHASLPPINPTLRMSKSDPLYHISNPNRRSGGLTDECLQMLSIKNEQNLILWAPPSQQTSAHDCDNGNALTIGRNWHRFNQWISQIIDPVTNRFYEPIDTSIDNWISKFDVITNPSLVEQNAIDFLTLTEHCVDTRKIIKQLLGFYPIQYFPLMEIIHQSNPSLIPMVKYSPQIFAIKCDIFANHNGTKLDREILQKSKSLHLRPTQPNNDGFVYLDKK